MLVYVVSNAVDIVCNAIAIDHWTHESSDSESDESAPQMWHTSQSLTTRSSLCCCTGMFCKALDPTYAPAKALGLALLVKAMKAW